MANVLLGAIDLQYSGSGVVADGPTNLPFDASVEQGGLYVDQPKGGNFVINPPMDGGGMITLPTDYFPGGPSGGGGAAPDLREDTGVEKPIVDGRATPPEVRKQWEEANKKRKQRNMIALGIGGLVLAYLLLRKK